MHYIPLFLCISGVHAVPTLYVNLDDPPKKRFAQVATRYKKQLPAMMISWADQIAANVNVSMMAEWLQYHNLAQEQLDELQGIVEVVNHSDVTMDRLILWQLMYELHHPTFCSGLLAAENDGTVIHGRNMDYTFFFKAKDEVLNWPDVTYETVWLKGGRPLFTTTGWPGHIGASTGMRFNGWTVEQNTRKVSNFTNEQNLAQAKLGGLGHNMVLRKMLESIPSFEFAVIALYTANVMAPQYFIMSGTGPYQGAVITRDRGVEHKPDTPPVVRLSQSHKLWHVVQTNDDMNRAPADLRRPIANGLLEMHKQREVNPEFVLSNMRTPPLFNLATVFTWIAKVQSGEHYTFIPDQDAKTVHGLNRARSGRGLQRWLAPQGPKDM